MGQPSIRHRALGMLWFHTPNKGPAFIPCADLKVAAAALLADAGRPPHATRGQPSIRTIRPHSGLRIPHPHGALSHAGFDLPAGQVEDFAEHWLPSAVAPKGPGARRRERYENRAEPAGPRLNKPLLLLAGECSEAS